MVERRRMTRIPIRKPAAIRCKASKKPVKCVITDLSARGARLSLTNETRLSDRIVLCVHGDNLRLDAAVRWFDGAICGVQFSREIAHPYLTRHRMDNVIEEAQGA